MIKSIDFPNKSFETKEELFKALKESKEFLISAKKSVIHKAIEKSNLLTVSANQDLIKKLSDVSKSIDIDDNYYYFVVNSSNVLDSHLDLHISGNWEKSAKEQQGKCYLVFDHELKRNEIVAMKNDVEMFTATIPFKAIGKNYDGNTYVLIYKVRKDKIVNEQAEEWLQKGYNFECSVRMQYMDIDLAMNSDQKGDEKEKENYDKYHSQIANRNDFESIDYFWIVKQAKNVLESSLVLFGSNHITGRIEDKSEPVSHSDVKAEPSDDTQSELINFLTKLKVK